MRCEPGTVSLASRLRAAAASLGCVAAVLIAGVGCTPSSGAPAGVVSAVGAENQYANVIAQIGGRYVQVTAVMSNPDTDPHAFEASPQVARQIAQAQLVVQNGLGYDTFMNRLEDATSNSGRTVIDTQKLLGLPDSTPNPHLWYRPATMPAVAAAVARELTRLQPGHAAYFRANVVRFDAKLKPWLRAIASLRTGYPSVPVATTEPVADYLLDAAGVDVRTPWTLQADVMNGVDPAPQDVSAQEALISSGAVKALLYNRQVTDSLTASFLSLARAHGVPVVAVYETMPSNGYDYQRWMLAETDALLAAVQHGTSTTSL
jgi:zinc/manganese transport system substrate-binding protein